MRIDLPMVCLKKLNLNSYPDKVKTDELDKIKELDKQVEFHNKNSNYFYHLKLVKSVKRPWF